MLCTATIKTHFQNLRSNITKAKQQQQQPAPNEPLSAVETSARPTTDHSLRKHPARCDPCYTLWNAATRVVLWFDDVPALYGGRSEVRDLDLHLLVDNPDKAAEVLLAAGYERAPPFNRREVIQSGIRVALPDGPTAVILICAAECCFDLASSPERFLPPLSLFLGVMMEFWLQMPSQTYKQDGRFAMYIARLIGYCYNCLDDGVAVNDEAYAAKLEPYHRELHSDIVHGEDFTSVERHEYHVQRSKEIKAGLLIARP